MASIPNVASILQYTGLPKKLDRV